jgi:hypothetical protein
MCTVRLDAATLASIQGGTISKEQAQEILQGLKGQLRNTDGSIKSGVLSFSRETGVISTARWWNFGSRSSGKMAETADLMKQLIRSAYGDAVYAAGVQADLEAYLTTTSSKFGSESFVKLIDSLERLGPESGEGPAKGAPTPGRLQLGKLEALTFHRRLAAAEPDEAARLQLEELDAHLSPQTKTYFSALLAPRALGAGTTRVLGDGDGSVARMTLMAIHSGRMQLGSDGLKKLATAMNKEAAAGNSRHPSALTDFQSDGQLARDLDEMVSGAFFLPGQGDLVFIGDIMHDRFSCDKRVTANLVSALHDTGAVFIKGNHDVYDECFASDHRSALRANQSGERAIQLPPTEAREVERLFVHAHYDSTTSTFYSHNGVRLKPGTENVYQTAFGKIIADSPQELADRMRETPYLVSDRRVFTNYRPKDTDMHTSHMGPAGRAGTHDVRFVHGHNDNFGTSVNVVNVNARQKSQFAPVGFVL